MKLKTGAVNRDAKPIEVQGAKFFIRPLSGELYTAFSLYVQEAMDSMMADRDKRTFIKNHLVDWEGVEIELEDGKVEMLPFNLTTALDVLLDPDADDVMTLLFSEALAMRGAIDETKKTDEEKAKK